MDAIVGIFIVSVFACAGAFALIDSVARCSFDRQRKSGQHPSSS
ncbi:hypothetical protein Bra1253DRAFT_07731 [Bradyrhizobium sp. WSM1253]|nr:hypothetical protein Bra1253DRAFT_07731 [Bradyrhizobium sp. WSM1253]